MNQTIEKALLILILAVVCASPQESVADDDEYSVRGLPGVVRQATRGFHDVTLAEAAGYGAFLGCVSGNQRGAMGVHYANGALVGDDTVVASQPEILVYEPQRNGRMRLVAVEYIVFADAWHAANEAPPVLMGQVFHYTGSPNRYGLPAFYALHVWAWKHNSNGVFADWNPAVSCRNYTGNGG